MRRRWVLGLLSFLLTASTGQGETSPPDLSKDKVLYAVAYAHLDTQWLWTYQVTIDEYLRHTLEGNFRLFETYPNYKFNFTGSIRYQMFKEYYPERYEKLKEYIAQDRWLVSGSSVDEGDVNVPSPESIWRQVLYGNKFFKQEFGKESVDYMLPDCFGFPASLPTIWAHAGLLGFSTQKLTWGSAVGIPFNVGVWRGPDGQSVIAALNPGEYVGRVHSRLDQDSKWIQRVNDNGLKYGLFTDYHYYGVGDRGGAPRDSDVRNVMASLSGQGPIKVIGGASDQMFRDITPKQKQQLPVYQGDLLLTEHSAGTLTSKAYMKRWNRKNELLADAAERASVTADWLGATPYPREKLETGWLRVLASQMHDILPGTSIPEAYEFSYNDEIIGLNTFAEVDKIAVGAVSRSLDTATVGAPVVVYNPLSIERTDPAIIDLPRGVADDQPLRVFNSKGREVPSQKIIDKGQTKLLFLAAVKPMSFSVFDIRNASEPYQEPGTKLTASTTHLTSDIFEVTLAGGDIASIIDKSAGGRELLAAPTSLDFQYEQPRSFPAWNMEWRDRVQPPYAKVAGPVSVRVLERGPVRVSVEVTRESQGSKFVQRIQLLRGSHQVNFDTSIDWLTPNSSLKAAFPLTVAHPTATYNWEVGTIERGNNDPKKFEVPSHHWFDITEADNSYGVSVLEDGKFGSDKPSDNLVRLTLLYSPNTDIGGFHYEATQDWGHHDFSYALYGHQSDWRTARSDWAGLRYNQPLQAFAVPKHQGNGGRAQSFAQVDADHVAITALKKGEYGDIVVVRLQELRGQSNSNVRLAMGHGIVSAQALDAQERVLGPASIDDQGRLVFEVGPYSPKTFGLVLRQPNAGMALTASTSTPVPLAFDADVMSEDSDRTDGRMDSSGATYPAELVPRTLLAEGIRFNLGSGRPGEANAIRARGQRIRLPRGDFNAVFLLAAAEEDTSGTFRIDHHDHHLTIQRWTGKIGDFDTRIWSSQWILDSIQPGFIKRDSIAWFGSHRHMPYKNDAYRFSYLFKYRLPVTSGAKVLRLPQNDQIVVFAVTAARDENHLANPLSALYDEFFDRKVRQPGR